jgi:peptidoglycan/xylan/chitin deacetylase (PgdA/CDA1 family)
MSTAPTSLVITIDTEPDDQWRMPRPGEPLPRLTFSNTRNLRRLIGFLRRLNLRATWMITYSVARDTESARQLASAAADGDEIACHLHAWETPPPTLVDKSARSYIFEYDQETRLAKLNTVTSALREAFGVRPVSYRAGRWGIDALEYDNLTKLGFSIDSSVVPGYTFRSSIGSSQGGPDFRSLLTQASPGPYRVGHMWEVPVSVTTAGGLCGDRLSAFLARTMASRRDIPSRIINKALTVTGISRLVWLRPLAHPRNELLRAALSMVRSGVKVINIMFHSAEIVAGTSPHIRTEVDVQRMYDDIEALVVSLLATKRVVPRTLCETIAV